MRIIATGRQTGKTTTVVSHLYAFDDAVLIVPTNQRARQLAEEYPDLADRIIPATSGAGLRGRNYGRVYVDDVDQVLHHLLGAPVYLATGTADVLADESKDDQSDGWWFELADIVAETYNQIVDQTDSIDRTNEQLAADVARTVGNWQLTQVVFAKD